MNNVCCVYISSKSSGGNIQKSLNVYNERIIFTVCCHAGSGDDVLGHVGSGDDILGHVGSGDDVLWSCWIQ